MDLVRDAYCGSCLNCVPRWRDGDDPGKKSRDHCFAVKGGNEDRIAKIAAQIRRHRSKDGTDDMLGADATLVPMPRNAPSPEGALWPARMLADALAAERLGSPVLPLLERAVAVPNSATAAAGMPPKVADHLKSFRVSPRLDPPDPIVVDVVTSGATMLAAISAVAGLIPVSLRWDSHSSARNPKGSLRLFRAPRVPTSACSGTAGHGGFRRRGSHSWVHAAGESDHSVTASLGRPRGTDR